MNNEEIQEQESVEQLTEEKMASLGYVKADVTELALLLSNLDQAAKIERLERERDELSAQLDRPRIALIKERNQLLKKNEELAAQNERLREAGGSIRRLWNQRNLLGGAIRAIIEKWDRATSESPEQSLAHVRAEAGFDGFIEGCLSESRRDQLTWAERASAYAQRIRQSAKQKGDEQ